MSFNLNANTDPPGKPRSSKASHLPWIAVVLLFLGLGSTAWFFGGTKQAQPSNVSPAPAPSADVTKSSPEQVMRMYLDAKTWEERLKFARNPGKIAQLKKKLNSVAPEVYTPYEIVDQAHNKPGATDRHETYSFAVQFKGDPEAIQYEVVPTAGGFKVDWESQGINPMSLTLYAVERPTVPMKFRVGCSLANIYLGDFANCRDTHYSIEIFDNSGGLLLGYAERDSPIGKQLIKGLGDGREYKAILELQQVGPLGRPLTHSSGEQVTIKRMVSRSWVDWEE